MKRKFVVAILAVLVSGTLISAQPTAARGGSCQAFGTDTAGLAQDLGRDFGQATKVNPDVSGFVAGLHEVLCEDNPAE
jgi:hypothetical protein